MKKINCKLITVLLISAIFIFSSVNNAYAFSGKDDSFIRVQIANPDVKFSDFFCVSNRTDGGFNYIFIDSAVYPTGSFFCVIEESTIVNGNSYIQGRAAYISTGGTVSYINGAFSRNSVQNADGTWGSLTSCHGYLYNTFYGPCDIADTNIPIFSSEDGAVSYYLTGDLTGFKNSDQCFLYSSDIESPKDLKITYSTNKLFNDDGSCDAPDFKFEWKQSEDVDLSGYKTEIYMQCTLVNPNLESIIKHDYSDSKLSNKIELETVNTQKQNSVICKWENYSTALYDESVRLHGYTPGMAIVVAPMYFWVRNVKGNTYGDWVKVKVTRDNVVESGSTFNGEGTVTGGYEKIDGGSGEQKDDGEYGNSYHVDVEYKNVTSIIDYIKNGFGLLGDTGLIAMIKDVFSFLPGPIWTMLLATFAVCCFIVIWKVIK